MIEVSVIIPTILVSAIIEATVLPCLPATVENSSGTYIEEVQPGETLILPDNTYRVYVNDVLVDTDTGPAIEDTTINILN